MDGARGGIRICAWLTASVLAGAIPLAPAAAAMTAEEVAAAIAERFDVEVLRVEPAEDDGRRVFRVTVMQPGGNSNAAWRVTTLPVDAETGELVRQFRHRSSGYELPNAPQYKGDIEDHPRARRGFVWR